MPVMLFKDWLHGKNWRYIHETITVTNHNTCFFIHKKQTYSFNITNDDNDILQIYFNIHINTFLRTSQIIMKICTQDLDIETCNKMSVVHNGSLHIKDIYVDADNVYLKDIHKKLIGEYLIKKF
jgi:hypothetical protein